MSCEEAIEEVRTADLAVTTGAIHETVQIIDMEDEALAYYPGNASRLEIRVAGGLRGE